MRIGMRRGAPQSGARRHFVGESLAGRFVDAIDRSNRIAGPVADDRLCFASATLGCQREHRNQREAQAVATDIAVAGMAGRGSRIMLGAIVRIGGSHQP